MRTNKFLIVFLLSVFNFVKVPQAQIIPLADTFKQGIYDISKFSGYYGTARLTTPDKPVTLIIIAPTGAVKHIMKIDTTKEVYRLGPVLKGDTMVIVGAGEIFASGSK